MNNPYENKKEEIEEVVENTTEQVKENSTQQPTQPNQYQTNASYNNANYYHQENTGVPPQYNTYQRPPQAPPQYPYQASQTWGAPPPPRAVKPPKPPKRPMSKGERIWITITACVLSCIIASAGSLAVFTHLLTSGFFTITAEDEGGGYIITQTKIVDENAEPTPLTSSGSLTDQEISEMVLPSVVCISNYQVTNSIDSFGATYGFQNDQLLPASEGSGVICSEDGYIITNNHVVDGATSLKVTLYDGTVHEAELIGTDSLTDLAVIKIEADDLTPAEFGVSEDLTVADSVLAIGNPGGMEFSSSVTSGIVSALERSLTSGDTGYTMQYIQTDAAISPGNSGGALVNKYGQVVGINSAKISETSYEGLGFAIPSDTFLPIVDDIIEHGKVTNRAVLGISCQYVDSMTARFYGLTEGVYVGEVTSELAKKSGLQAGDIITEFNGEVITSSNALTGMIASMSPGDIVTLTVYRSSTEENNIQIEVQLTN